VKLELRDNEQPSYPRQRSDDVLDDAAHQVENFGSIVAGAVGDGGVAERRVSGLSPLTPDRADARGC
jgi:hypothetical protein